MVGDLEGGTSTTSYVFTIRGTIVSWISKIQQVVALSTIEAKYVIATKVSKELIWLKRLMEELGKVQEDAKLWNDS